MWCDRAQMIPDAPIRINALGALANKRGHTDGAALFTIIPQTRDADLLRLLVAYELIWDFLDSVNEGGARAGQDNGRQLHLALIDAFETGPLSDYYCHHPWRQDGGYLRTLVEVCRACLSALPAYELARVLLLEEAKHAQVLAVNHDLDPQDRDADLEAWAENEFPACRGVSWFELSGAASASLTVHALLALGAIAESSEDDVERVQRAYFPWISAATTMLDSYVDQIEDACNGDHSYVAHYGPAQQAIPRICELIRRSLNEARALPGGERHALIVSCMVAMYLTKDSAHTPQLRATTALLRRSAGSLTALLFPILRAWRIAYAQRSA